MPICESWTLSPGGMVVIFAKKQEKIWHKKLILKEIIKKKRKNPRGESNKTK